jgi:hypothetical protein
MALDPSTFDYLRARWLAEMRPADELIALYRLLPEGPLTDAQMDAMVHAREAARVYADALYRLLPEDTDKTYVERKLREVSMWAMIAIAAAVCT